MGSYIMLHCLTNFGQLHEVISFLDKVSLLYLAYVRFGNRRAGESNIYLLSGEPPHYEL